MLSLMVDKHRIVFHNIRFYHSSVGAAVLEITHKRFFFVMKYQGFVPPLTGPKVLKFNIYMTRW